ncbi:hypothetical protein BEH_26680 (plasmid) [Priestia filamentosa]|uniref:Uncharacterized protein n=1 Tax=Priestia filamentosa TaxID=1402861 RepID=A0A2S1LZX0_9BACI|nr:type II toxin-antitoxin system PemK/MazF family toxin [Priestia filamentosa]AWG44367.1 hypothetical protein BEH_26680 [Priestia filamentosa]
MGLLRDNETKKQTVKDKTKNLFSELLDCDEDYAIKLIDWYLEKTKTNKKNIEETEIRKQIKALNGKTDQESADSRRKLYKNLNPTLPRNHPRTINKGDVLYVNYGQGYGAEISNGHYGVVLKRKGSNYLVAPLTKTQQPDAGNTMILRNLGLPAKGNQTVQIGYVNFGQVKFVHYRRLEKVRGTNKVVNVASQLQELLQKFNNIINS